MREVGMEEKASPEKEIEDIKRRLITREGWFVPTLHGKYLHQEAGE